MRTIALLLAAACFSACKGGPPRETPCKFFRDAEKDKAAAFITRCLEGANPKSDEEPEDWIDKCRDFALDVYGIDGTKIQVQSCADCYWRDSTSCRELAPPEVP